jgi:hypothetical protein
MGSLLLVGAELTGLSVPTAHAALLLTLGSALTLAVTFLMAIWPGGKARLTGCQH